MYRCSVFNKCSALVFKKIMRQSAYYLIKLIELIIIELILSSLVKTEANVQIFFELKSHMLDMN